MPDEKGKNKDDFLENIFRDISDEKIDKLEKIINMLGNSMNKASLRKESQQLTETALNFLLLINAMIKINGLCKTIEDIKDAVSEVPHKVTDNIPKEVATISWNAMRDSVKELCKDKNKNSGLGDDLLWI